MHYNNLNNFTGKLRFFNVNGSFSNGWVYDKGRITGKLSLSPDVPNVVEIAGSSKLMSTKNNKLMTVPAGECSPEYIPITGMACVGSGGYQTCTPYTRWEYIENHCNDGGDGGNGGDYYGSHGGGGSGGGEENSSGSNTIPENPYIPGADHLAIKLKDYIKCFENISNTGASYKIIVQVQEPVKGTSLNYGPINGVGHTAITLIKQGSNGFKVTQTVGFYPSGNSFNSPSKIVDNAKSGVTDNIDFTIRMTFDLAGDATNFNKVLNEIANPPSQYDLLTSNCTTFVTNACKVGGLKLPSAVTYVITPGPVGVYAETPGGLGYNMRQAKAGGDNRIASGEPSTGENPTSNGPCN